MILKMIRSRDFRDFIPVFATQIYCCNEGDGGCLPSVCTYVHAIVKDGNSVEKVNLVKRNLNVSGEAS